MSARETKSLEIRDLLKHAISSILIAALILGVAIGLSFLEHKLTQMDVPSYLSIGVRIIAVNLLIVDGIVICGTAFVIVIKVLRNQVLGEMEQRYPEQFSPLNEALETELKRHGKSNNDTDKSR